MFIKNASPKKRDRSVIRLFPERGSSEDSIVVA